MSASGNGTRGTTSGGGGTSLAPANLASAAEGGIDPEMTGTAEAAPADLAPEPTIDDEPASWREKALLTCGERYSC